MNAHLHSHLPRLEGSCYQAHAIVHWVHTLADRATGWLDGSIHARFRELMLHTMVRYDLLCPVYCVMPDHIHLLWTGVAQGSDQQKGCAFFRRHLSLAIRERGVCLQKQAYDHVLLEPERERNALEKIAWYITENPVRAGLVKKRTEWHYGGCVVPGYPDWSVFEDKYWTRFWREYERKRATP